MTLWDMQSDESTLAGVLFDEPLETVLVVAGSNPVKTRRALRAAGANPMRFQLVKGNRNRPETRRQAITDILLAYNMPVLSARGAALARRLGSVDDDFWPCRFDTNPDEAFFLVLPDQVFDIVDKEGSVFSRTLPLDPPLPLAIGTLRLRRPAGALPPLLRTLIPDREMTFPELIARDDFKAAWEKAKFTGATFRRLC